MKAYVNDAEAEILILKIKAFPFLISLSLLDINYCINNHFWYMPYQ